MSHRRLHALSTNTHCHDSASNQIQWYVQDAAQQYRLEHYLRRYYAQECDARQIQLSADWMAALLYSSTPATGV